MAIELYREGSEAFQLEYFGIWEKLMDLAHIYGWVPAGTSEPPAWDEEGEASEWSGRYDVYLGEWVDEADANALADALRNALPDLPDTTMPDRIFETEMEETDREGHISISFHIIEPNTALILFEVFGGQYKSELIAFIEFCRLGGCHTYSLRGFPS